LKFIVEIALKRGRITKGEGVRNKIVNFHEKDEAGKTLRTYGPFEQILIITEAPQWKVESIPQPPPPADPLVVGRIGSVLWLIDAFDVTPVENLVRAEWTTGPIKKE